jgi:hypothetical protein
MTGTFRRNLMRSRETHWISEQQPKSLGQRIETMFTHTPIDRVHRALRRSVRRFRMASTQLRKIQVDFIRENFTKEVIYPLITIQTAATREIRRREENIKNYQAHLASPEHQIFGAPYVETLT